MCSSDLDIDKIYLDIKTNKNDFKKKNKKLIIDDIGVNLNEKAKNNELDPVIGREKELNRLIEVLSRRSKNNPILVGEAGVGKTAVVEELSKRIVEGRVPKKLQNKKIYLLDMASTVAGTKYRGEFEERIKKILEEVSNDTEVILFIDEIHTLVGAGGEIGRAHV